MEYIEKIVLVKEEEKRTITNEKGINQHKEVVVQNEPQAKERTSEKIAQENNINESTVRRNAEYSKAIDKIKEHQKESDSLREALEKLDYYNDKVSFLVSEWIVDYGFSEKPDPYKAIAWGKNQDKDIHATQSAKWFWEYNRIFELVEMIHDYNNIMRDMLAKIKF